MNNEFISSDLEADKAIASIKAEREDIARIEGLAKAEIDEITERVSEAKKSSEAKIKMLENKLNAYFDRCDTKESKTQFSYKLLHGTLVLKKEAEQLKRADNDVLIDFVKRTSPKYIKVSEEVNWAEYKKTLNTLSGVVVDENGEVVEGIEIEQVPPKFIVK